MMRIYQNPLLKDKPMAFHKREEKKLPVEPEKIIEINAQMKGDLVFSDPVNLRINGRYMGKLETRGTLTIGQEAIIEANIVGDNIVIAGRIKGNVMARKMLVLMPTAHVAGDISSPKLNIVEGAVFQGHCQMIDDFLTVEDVAQYLEIEPQAIVDLASNGKIPAVKEGDQWRFERVKIDQWAATGEVS